MPASANPARARRPSARAGRTGSAPPGPAGSEPAGTDPATTGDAATGPTAGTGAATTGNAAGTQPDYRVEALAKGLRVLSVFSEQRPTWRITDIAAEVSLPLPTAYRIVMTLTAEGYLDHLPSGEYRPGVRVLTLGTAALRSLDLVELATPKLQELANATREKVNLAVLSGDQVLYLVRLRNSDLVTANIRVGSLLPAVHTSIGKLLLAFLGEDELARAVTNESFDGTTGPNAKRTLDELRPELATIRAQGWAMQDEELAYGLRSVAAPVRGENGAVVAGANLAVQSRDWPAARITRELRPMVLETCAEISRLLGYPGS
jgi:IclR family pca regulon transcriptional regulator